jgi:DNA ligase-1
MKPMLSASLDGVDLSTLRYPLLASPKLDGVRCLIIGGVAYSRNLKPIRNGFVQEWATRYHVQLEGLDGELVVGDAWSPHCLNVTQSGVMSFDGQPDFRYHVFDRWDADPDVPFVKRLAVAHSRDIERVEHVPHVLVHNDTELVEKEAEFLAQGYEGIMLRDPNGPYKNGRSTLREGYLMKLKRFMDGEAVVVGFEEALENQNEAKKDELGRTKRSSHAENYVGKKMVGTIIVEDKTWGTLRLSPGTMIHLARIRYFEEPSLLVGKTVHWRAFGYGVKDKPRFPRFYGIREDHE